MVVTRKKKAQKPRLAGHGEGFATLGGELVAHDRRDSKLKASMYTDSPKIGVADKTSMSIQKWQSAKGREMRLDSKQGRRANGLGQDNAGIGEKKAILRIFKFGSNSGVVVKPNEGQPDPTPHSKGLDISRTPPVFRFGSFAPSKDHGECTREMKDFLQRENYSNQGHDDQYDQEGSYRNHRVVRMGANESLAEPIPTD